MTNSNKIKPFVKTAGGKSRMLKTLVSHLPEDFFTKNYTYVEPFLGGGSFGLHLLSLDQEKKAFFNEFNFDLYNLWSEVQEGFSGLTPLLDTHIKNNSKEYFNQLRANFLEYSILEKSNQPLAQNFYTHRAADFLYLNKTCFNGLIRYNKRGKFNSPYGQYEKPLIYDRDNLNAVTSVLKRVTLSNLDFEDIILKLIASNKINSDTFIYMDPPYLPQSPTANFVEYTGSGFSVTDHLRMKRLVDKLTKLGAKVLISNSDTQTTRKIYKKYKIISVYNNRSIGAKGSTRGKIQELLIKNY